MIQVSRVRDVRNPLEVLSNALFNGEYFAGPGDKFSLASLSTKHGLFSLPRNKTLRGELAKL